MEALTRATRYAERKGAVNVAAAGDARTDLAADEVTDTSSPNGSTAVERTVNPRRVPGHTGHAAGLVTVSATGAKGLKSSYSNYGQGAVDIAAPSAATPPADCRRRRGRPSAV